MNNTVLLALAFLLRDDRRDGGADRFRLYEELKALLDPPLNHNQIRGLVDLIESGERHEGRRALLPMVMAMAASQAQTSASTTTAPATTTTTTGIDPSILIALALLSQP